MSTHAHSQFTPLLAKSDWRMQHITHDVGERAASCIPTIAPYLSCVRNASYSPGEMIESSLGAQTPLLGRGFSRQTYVISYNMVL